MPQINKDPELYEIVRDIDLLNRELYFFTWVQSNKEMLEKVRKLACQHIRPQYKETHTIDVHVEDNAIMLRVAEIPF